MVECTLSITHCLRLNLQLHTIDLARSCRISSFCTVAWQLARFQLTRLIARSLGDSLASCADSARARTENEPRNENRLRIRRVFGRNGDLELMYACSASAEKPTELSSLIDTARKQEKGRKTETETYRRRNCYGQKSVELILREGRRAIGPALLYVRSRSEKSRWKRSEINVLALQPVFFPTRTKSFITSEYEQISSYCGPDGTGKPSLEVAPITCWQ